MEIIQKSSNVGSSKIALLMQPQTLWQMFDDVGFGRPPQSGFPGEASGRVRPYKTWKPIEQATMSYGHGISTQPDAAGARLHHLYPMTANSSR